jgi:pimeloyl-ACP methyl ester carboxylesterase
MTAKAGRPSSRVINDGLAMYRYGTGEPVLLMPYPHGISAVPGPVMQALVRGLKDLGRQVITFDVPQSGRSSRPTRLNMDEVLECAEEALTVWGVKGPVDVLGHCHGGWAALGLAVERPERVRRLILAGTFAAMASYQRAPGALWNRSHPLYWRWRLWMVALLLSEREAVEKLMWNVIRRASFVDQTYFVPRPVRRRDLIRHAGPRARWLDPLPRGGASAPRRLDYRPRLQEVRVPTLVLAGAHDAQMPPSCSEELAKGIPDARLISFERSGHHPFVEEPEAFWVTIGRFLSSEQINQFDHQQATGLAAP